MSRLHMVGKFAMLNERDEGAERRKNAEPQGRKRGRKW